VCVTRARAYLCGRGGIADGAPAFKQRALNALKRGTQGAVAAAAAAAAAAVPRAAAAAGATTIATATTAAATLLRVNSKQRRVPPRRLVRDLLSRLQVRYAARARPPNVTTAAL
jgi:hypothetical protein